ncbi:type I methionyl aminopeptidase [Paenibacillus sp. FSL H7-0331]|jgi:methionyl aminopeptidase|uniref:type I methionyl aminopeptidase n=1 Tax=Paenibacillus sp. FSL H7-0331 TaxID=1920421 RepID=UPI00096FD487|nr:type I methionyl aminopeptidase [Paenibacillus sp. FSL H7-0331]OMF18680.1 type I methionyl aminopeptidase [Paenibacillus sp. FSL H7-0331]
MIIIKSKQEIAQMREAGLILARCHQEIAKRIKPGVTSWEIDQFVEKFLQENGATPEQKGFHGYEYATCASVNDVICHGFPKKEPLRDGDIVTIDMVVNLDGWLADSAWSYKVGNVSATADKLLRVTKESLMRGIEQARIGNRMGDVGYAIQSYAEAEGFSVVRDFVGHGIGQSMHEEPQVPHYGHQGKGIRFTEGMVITIEPMINEFAYQSKTDPDGWTARTLDGGLSAQYEHTIAITSEGPIILTQL